MIQRQIDVALGERSYPIYFGTGMTASFAPTCQLHGIPRQVVIVTDTNVAQHYLESLQKHLHHFEFEASSIILPPGETQKSLSRANAIFTALLQRRTGRKATIIALGGGVVGDLAGFVAATYQRGVTLIQVPTTLLAQVDSSVGGKVAVNHPLGKNMIGAFYQPKFVWIDGETLRTLPSREVICGLAEVAKYGVIFDAEFFAYLETNLEAIMKLDHAAVMHIQARCCELKARVVAEDERELGLRAVLNYGHTVGHALEFAGKYRALKHGEAVLLGMAAEAFIAQQMGLLSAEVLERIEAFVSRIPLEFKKETFAPSKILDAIRRDKKSVDGKTRFVLPVRLGEVRILDDVEPELIRLSLKRAFGLVGKKRSSSH
ncbi:MAG: 3-dehydroquinate synthase [Ignavibacteriales bacterium]|nr:3-dehydroquinate synthase [Ignavibacteriales bacterium]